MTNEFKGQVVNHDLAMHSGNHVTVGRCFAFIKPAFFENPAFSWLGDLLGRKASKRINIINLLKPGGTELAGVRFQQKTFGQMELSSITSDKSLYRADSDTVDLLLVNPQMASSLAAVKILTNGAPFSRHEAEIGKHGAGKLTLQDLPAGDYEVSFEKSTNPDRCCKFSVAQYKLVPLVAEMKERLRLSESSLEITVYLSSFGVSANGPVLIEVFDRGIRQTTIKETARDGIIKFKAQLSGDGPHSLNFQMVDEPAKTASLPIIGSRASERSLTLINPLGTEIFASLLPAEGATEVRGLYLSEGGISNTPLRLEIDANQLPVLKTAAAIDSLVVLSISPDFPLARADAPEIGKAPHPENFDEDYKGASRLFNRGLIEDALRLFQQARAKQTNPHAYYAYFEACCHARLGHKETAFARLRQAISDGWKDYGHMQQDEDLKALHGDSRFAELSSGGYSEYSFENLAPDQIVELPCRPALNLLVIGAVIKDQAWEGWTSFITPSEISMAVESKPEYKSGQSLELKFKVNGNAKDDCSVYVVVKDARLLSQDKPEARLAAAMKDFIASESKTLAAAYPKDTVATLAASTPQSLYGQVRYSRTSQLYAEAEGGGPADSWGGAAGSWGASPSALSGPPLPPQAPSARSPLRPQAPSPQARMAQGTPVSSPSPAGADTWSLNKFAAAEEIETGSYKKFDLKDGAEEPMDFSVAGKLPVQKGHEPEVLHADFLPLTGGEATLVLPLPIQESDYVAEYFVISNCEWRSGEARFRAVADPLAEFTLPRFVAAGETASAWLHAGTRSEELTCCVYHNNKEIELTHSQKPFGKTDRISTPLVDLSFAAGTGSYRAVLKNLKGEQVATIEQNVDEPGKLKRRVRSIRLLKPGDSCDLSSDDSITSMRMMPGLQNSFKLLLDATADYGHACCEQTAAKILSACAMYMFSGQDAGRRDKASSIIIAGINREEKMFLPRRGFKMYPENTDQPDMHYGPMAARHLINLALLDPEKEKMPAPLSAALRRGLEMSADALGSYSINIPPDKFLTMHDAYQTCRFPSNGRSAQALAFVRNKTSDPAKFLTELQPDPCYGVAVMSRIEAAYAAAALIRQRQSGDLPAALNLANHVVKSFNEKGMLYSTTDSVAAIALFAELLEAKILGESGKAEINGVVQNIAEAIASCHEIKSVRCIEGVVGVEVERIVEEDWSSFSANVALRVSLEKNGHPQRSFAPGDQVDLRVQLEQGYKTGDILWLCLPDCLSRLVGGGQVKLFSVDFAGKAELVIPLAVTGSTNQSGGQKGQQKLAVCVRNMFEEERAASPGLIAISAAAR